MVKKIIFWIELALPDAKDFKPFVKETILFEAASSYACTVLKKSDGLYEKTDWVATIVKIEKLKNNDFS